MKVVLVAPDSKAHTITPPLGLGYLAAVTRQNGHDAAILDLAKEQLDPRQGAEALKHLQPDLIGVSVLSTAFLQARELISIVKREMPVVPVVVGGPHITALAGKAIGDLDVELGVVGEAEQIFPRLVDNIAAGHPLDDIPNFCRRVDGECMQSARSAFVQDLDSLPFPAWELMDPRTYPDQPHQLLCKEFPVAPVITSRGCPFDCTFCASTTLWGRGWRTRSAENIVDEIEYLVTEFGVKEIHFEDDNFTLNANHAAAVCDEIIKREIDVSWCTPNGVRVDSLDNELLSLMRRSGCYSLAFGIESGSQKVLDINNKKLDLEKVADAIAMVKQHGIETHGFFIIGLPGETHETIKETNRFARAVALDRANFALLSPLPGSEIFNKYVQGGGGTDQLDFESLNYFTPFAIGELDVVELKRGQRQAVYSFYLRPGPILSLARKVRPAQVKQLLRTLVDYST